MRHLLHIAAALIAAAFLTAPPGYAFEDPPTGPSIPKDWAELNCGEAPPGKKYRLKPSCVASLREDYGKWYEGAEIAHEAAKAAAQAALDSAQSTLDTATTFAQDPGSEGGATITASEQAVIDRYTAARDAAQALVDGMPGVWNDTLAGLEARFFEKLAECCELVPAGSKEAEAKPVKAPSSAEP
jgi:hypothetical protein